MQAGASSAVSIAVKSGFVNFSNDFMLFSSRWSGSSRGDHRSPAAAPTRSTFTSEHLTLSVGLTSAFNKVLLAQNLSNRDSSFNCGLMYGGSVGSRDNIDYGLNGKSSTSKTSQIVHRRSTERFLNVSCGRLEFHSKTCKRPISIIQRIQIEPKLFGESESFEATSREHSASSPICMN